MTALGESLAASFSDRSSILLISTNNKNNARRFQAFGLFVYSGKVRYYDAVFNSMMEVFIPAVF